MYTLRIPEVGYFLICKIPSYNKVLKGKSGFVKKCLTTCIMLNTTVVMLWNTIIS